jgi:signal recognition particle subunit SRP54
MRKKRVTKPLLIAADIYRPAAIQQLQTLAKSIHVDIYSELDNTNVVEIVKAGVAQGKERGNDLIIVDTAGRLSIDETLMNELKNIKSAINPNEILFVMDALSGQDIINVAETFHKELTLTGSVITTLDSDARGGAAFSIANILKIPIRFSGTGEKIENIDLFHPDRMAKRILGMGDVLSLIEKAEEVIDKDEAKHMANRLGAGHFDLNDLMMQLKQMKKLGKLSKIMKLIPGAKKIPKEKIESATKKLELFGILIDSMTKEERKYPRLLKQPKRKARIISGSGRSNRDYNLLVSEFDRMKKQMKAMTKAMKNGTFNPSMFGVQ